MGMQLTEENYYSDIANYEYMSVSQFKDFNGTYGRVACEEAALAKLKGEYAQASSTALMVGSYVDRYFEGTLDAFKSEHTEMFKKDGNLKAEYVKADALIQRAERDELFMKYILEYTSQETTDPDPVMAMNKFVKELYPECIVVGLDRMEEITEASRETPVIYCRLNSMEKVEETNTVVWMDGKLAIHILCPDTDMRLKMAAAITNAMSLDGEVTMLDYSPMFIRKLQMDNKSDYLKDGQIFVTGRYGLLRYKAKPHQLNRTTQNYF